jgi:hypothetical protein
MTDVIAVRSGAPSSTKALLGRVGLVGEGVVYALVGFLALQVAAGNRAQADQIGAVEYVARQPFGKFLLVALTAALFALGAWRLLEVRTGDPVEGSDGGHRVKYAVKGVLYLGVAVSALSITLANWGKDSGGGGGGRTGAATTATVFEWPAGRWLVVLAGVLLIAYALYSCKEHAVDHRFAEWLTEPADSWLVRLGRIGYVARAVVYVVVAVFLIQAAVAYDPSEAKGISGALRELSAESWGRMLVWGVAAGLMAFGVFLVAQARYRRAT